MSLPRNETARLFDRQIAIVSSLFGFAALLVILARLHLLIPGTQVVTDPREIFVLLGAAITGPAGGFVIGLLASLGDPQPALIPYIATNHIFGAVLVGWAYRRLVYDRTRMPLLAVAWIGLVSAYYFLFPTAVIAFFKTAFPVYFLKVVPIEADLWQTLGILYGGWLEEFALTSFVTVIALSALPATLRQPLWGRPRGHAVTAPEGRPRSGHRLLGLRLTAWFVVLSILPLIIVGVALQSHLPELFMTEIAEHHREIAEKIGTDERIRKDPAAFASVTRPLSLEGDTAFLLDRQGFYISHNDSTRVRRDSRADIDPKIIDAILRNHEGHILGETRGTAYVFAPLEGTEYTVVVVVATHGALKALRAFEETSLMRLALALLVLSGVAGLVIWILVGRPLRSLSSAARRIGQGDLSARVDTHLMDDEVAELGLAFNEMGIDLASLNRGLQEEVSRHSDTVEALKESEAKFRTIIEQFADGFLLMDAEGTIRECNRAEEQIVGLPRSEIIGKSVWSITAPRIPHRLHATGALEGIRERMQEMLRNPASPGFFGPHEFPYLRPDGSEGYLQQVHFLIRFKEGNMLGGVSRDISERHRVEERVRTSLAEKELMLREIHHRVKNNLQVISSLLSLQSGSIRDPHDLSLFRESENRIRSMALIHEKLYQSEDFSKVDFRQYIEGLAGYLFRSYRVADVTYTMAVDDLRLGINTAIPCGLILNELLTNALKHAFHDGRKGHIRVELRSVEGNRVRLTVRDDGVGLPSGFDPEKTQSLGMHLTRILAAQLDGSFRYSVNGGTTFEIEFPGGGD